MKIEITILGLLMTENLYGYEIKKKIVEKLEDYVDIKFGSIYYAIKKAVENGWVKRVGTEKHSGNPERYVYEILPPGRKYYKKLLKQYFERNLIHFDIDIVLMFFSYLSLEQKKQFVQDRLKKINHKLKAIRNKISEKEANPGENSYLEIFRYMEHHLQAEINWLKSLGWKGE